MDNFSIIACAVIIVATILALVYIIKSSKTQLASRRNRISQLPSLISTLGVLGTFIGITRGLIAFDTKDLVQSIPELLDGLKTAFFTSLCGMVGSLVVNRVVAKRYDNLTAGSEQDRLVDRIVKAINDNGAKLDIIAAACADGGPIHALADEIGRMEHEIDGIRHCLEEIRSMAGEGVDNSARTVALLLTATASVTSLDNTLSEIKDKTTAK